MKRYNNLFDKICTIANFNKALDNAIKGKKYYIEVKKILISRWRVISKLYKSVKDQNYKVGKYTVYDMWTGHKWRTIYKVPMVDRIVQHAIMIHIEKIFRDSFINDTFQSIKGRGIHQCLKRIKRFIKDKDGAKYCLTVDIHKCYPSIDKEILKYFLTKKFKDKLLLWLLFVIVDSCDKGVPIGNYTSQYFNNYYFSFLDHFCKEVLRIKYYVRYCDNILIFGADKELLRFYYNEINKFVNNLHVKINNGWQIYPIDKRGIDAFGYVVYTDHVLLRKSTKLNFIRACKNINFDDLSERDINVLGSYWGIMIHADCRNLWFKYTGVKKFEDLHVKVHERKFIREILNQDIVINNVLFYNRRGENRVRLTIDIDDLKDVYVTTSGEILIEAARQFKQSDFPFTAQIIETENGYYKFK